MAKYQQGIIYILRDEFQIFASGLPSILQFKFVPEIVKDLDIVNKELLYSLLKMFISNNNIPKTSFIIVVSDSASIIKDFISPNQPGQQPIPPEKLQSQANEFIEHIPFEEVSSKTFPIDNGIRAYGTNKEMYESIKEALLLEGFEVLMVLPATALGTQVSTKNSLDADGINAILKKAPLVAKDFNLLKQPLQSSHAEEISTESNDSVKQEKKPDKKRLIILASVFVVLIIALIIVYMNQPK